MRRVAVTGVGAVSSLGNNVGDITHTLRHSRSGVRFSPEMQAAGFRSQVYAPVQGFDPDQLDPRAAQQLAPVAQYAVAAGLEASAAAGLTAETLPPDRTGVILGTILGGVNDVLPVERLVRETRQPTRAGTRVVTRMLNSGAASQLGMRLGARGRTYSLSSACSTGVDSIGHAYELIAYGMQDVCLCGAAEEDTWKHMGPSYDNWGAMPAAYNDRPTEACRPFEAERSGFVLSAGAGVLVLEELERARQRQAPIIAELVGYGSSNDGADMFHPTGDGARRTVLQALSGAAKLGVERVDYVNPHGAGTPVGDAIEVQWMRDVFGEEAPAVSSTKALSGHAMGAAGALEAVFTLIMMRDGFITPTANLDRIADDCAGVPHVREPREQPIRAALTVNVGLGGTNGALVFRQV